MAVAQSRYVYALCEAQARQSGAVTLPARACARLSLARSPAAIQFPYYSPPSPWTVF